MTTWINPKEAAALIGIRVRCFRQEWVPEEGPAQVRFRVTNGKTGAGRRIEIDLEDLREVLAARTHERVS